MKINLQESIIVLHVSRSAFMVVAFICLLRPLIEAFASKYTESIFYSKIYGNTTNEVLEQELII